MKSVGLRVKRTFRAFAWQLLGFAIVFTLLGIGIYRAETTRTLVEEDHNRSPERICVDFRKVGYQCPKLGTGRSISAARGGDDLQPAPAGQPPAPAPAGDTGGAKQPTDGEGAPAPPHTPVSQAPTPSPQPVATEPARSPEPVNSLPAATAPPAANPLPEAPGPEPPGLLTPALTKVCSVADRLVPLC